MFDKNEYLQQLENIMIDKIIWTLANNDKTKALELYFMVTREPDIILDLAEIKNRDISSLTAAVVQYGNKSSYYARTNLKLPFIIDSKISGKIFDKDYDYKKFLSSLLYLIEIDDNKYYNITIDVLYNYIASVYSTVHFRKLSLLESKEKLVEALTQLEKVVNNEDYKITKQDVDLLNELYDNTKIIKDLPIVKKVIDASTNVDYSLLAKFLGLNPLEYQSVNDYFNGEKIIEDIKNKKYSIDELNVIKLLALNMSVAPNNIGIFTYMNLKINPRRPNFYNVLKFIELYDQYTDGEKTVNFNKIGKYLRLSNNYIDDNSYYHDDVDVFREIYKEYRKQNFSFKIEEFCSYINSIKEDAHLEEVIARYKVLENSTDFDIYSFFYLIGSNSHSLDLDRFAPYIPYLLKTKSGEKFFAPILLKEKEAIKQLEDIYTSDTLNRLLPLAYNLADVSDYTIGSYAKRYVKPEDYQKFRAVCDWLRSKNEDIFKNSIDSEFNEAKDRERAKKETTSYFVNLPLKELNGATTINSYYKKVEIPFATKKGKTHTLGLAIITELYHSVYLKRLDDICLVEAKKLIWLMKEEQELGKYIDARGYTYKQAFDIISMASKKIDDEKAFSLLTIKLEEEVKNKERKEKLTKARKFIDILKNGSFDSMTSFYDCVAKEHNISRNEQALLLNVAMEDEELSEVIKKKKMEIKEKRALKNKEQTRKKLEYDIGKYGEEAVKAMRTFVKSDDFTIKKFCKTAGISEKDFKFYRRICTEIDEDLAIEVNDKCMETSKKFIIFIIKSAREVALEMKRCHKGKVPYDLYNHYEKYGVSPHLIADMSSRFDRVNESKLINDYMTIHSAIFSSISVSRLENMKRKTSIYSANFYLENRSVSYNKKDMEQATLDLSNKGIPLYSGTLYQALIRMKNDSKTGKKIYTKTK